MILTVPADKLTDFRIKALKPSSKIYRVADGRGLCLQVSPSGSKLWYLRYRIGKSPRMAAIGPYGNKPDEVSLKQARDRAREMRALIANGVDPVAAKKAPDGQTFKEVSARWVTGYMPKGRPQSDATKARHERMIAIANKTLGNMAIEEISKKHLRDVIRPFEEAGKAESAHRMKHTMSLIMSHALDDEGSERLNPALGLKALIPKARPKNRAHLTDEKAIGQLLRSIDDYQGSPTIKHALLFMMMTAARSGEIRTIDWADVDLESALWVVPAEKTKQRREHRAFLSTQALDVLRRQSKISGPKGLVFPTPRSSTRPLSESAFSVALKAIGYDGQTQTAHGFRGIFSTLSNERALARPVVIEHALGHSEPDQVAGAYNHASYTEERKQLAQAYADLLDQLRRDC